MLKISNSMPLYFQRYTGEILGCIIETPASYMKRSIENSKGSAITESIAIFSE